jgi:hypothetical protein
MIHKLNRFFQRTAIKATRMMNPGIEGRYNEDFNVEAFAICKRLISKRETTLLISPISGKRYIKSDDSQLFIIIESHQMTIVNHQYSYNIDIAGKAHERIAQVFDAEVERRREQMETEIRSNVKHSLSNIYKSLSNEKV